MGENRPLVLVKFPRSAAPEAAIGLDCVSGRVAFHAPKRDELAASTPPPVAGGEVNANDGRKLDAGVVLAVAALEGLHGVLLLMLVLFTAWGEAAASFDGKLACNAA